MDITFWQDYVSGLEARIAGLESGLGEHVTGLKAELEHAKSKLAEEKRIQSIRDEQSRAAEERELWVWIPIQNVEVIGGVEYVDAPRNTWPSVWGRS
jgi:hypothetical protein